MPLLQYRTKSGLFEMMIAGERVTYSALLHHDERNTISQRPFLVTSSPIDIPAACQEASAGRYDPNRGVQAMIFNELDHGTSSLGTRKAVREFGEDPIGGHHRACKRIGEL